MSVQTTRVPDWNTIEKTTLVRYVNVESVRNDTMPGAHAVIAAADPSVHQLVLTERYREAATVVYDGLATQEISYTGPGYSSESGTQRVFLPNELAERGRGTCVDLAVAFCALALEAELHPYLIGTPGHVFAMVANSGFAPMLSDDVTRDELLPLIEGQQLIPVETTGTTLEERCTFAEAVETSIEHLKTADIEFVLDVNKLQHVNGLQPYKPVPEAPGPNWRLLAVGAVVAIVAASGLAFWWLQPDPMAGAASTNIAVMAFAGDESGTADELQSRLADRLQVSGLGDSGWNVGGTFGGTFPSQSVDDDNERLDELNAGVGVFGNVDGDEITEVGVWITPNMEGSSFFGSLGPVALIEHFPNTNTNGRITIAAEQLEDFVELAQALSQVHNAFGECNDDRSECDSTDDQALDSASRTLLTLTQATGQSRTAAYQTQQLARLSLGQVSLSRLVYPGLDGELRSELIELARRMFKDTLAAAEVNGDKWSELRASLATSNMIIIIDQCAPSGEGLSTALAVLEHAEGLLAQLSAIERTHAEIRLEHAQAELAWCRWHADDLDREAALAKHDQAVVAIGGAAEEYFEDLQAHLLADTLFQRAELRAGVDPAGCEQDLAQASDLAPPFAKAVYDAQSKEWSCDE